MLMRLHFKGNASTAREPYGRLHYVCKSFDVVWWEERRMEMGGRRYRRIYRLFNFPFSTFSLLYVMR